jgi:CRP-like cAMP-binding protein
MDNFLPKIPKLNKQWNKYKHLFQEKCYPARTLLLREGEISRSIFFIEKGCLRAGFTEGPREITLQFFFENERVASFESFITSAPSDIFIETIEPSKVIILKKKDFDYFVNKFPEVKEIFFQIIIRRFSHYAGLFRSYITHNPRQRYLELLRNEPRIIQRVPQQYIASYLGITPVSLSRIRSKIR